jgi:Asp-tRNA(Asn)/Glu-tRNA(Gln) amidotransferase A subunit family amidase
MSYRQEVVRLALRRSDFTFPGLALSLLSDLLGKLPVSLADEVRRGEALRARLEDRLGDEGVLLGPTFPVAAPRHRGLLTRPFAHSTTCLWNVMAFPATSVPGGFDTRGLPVGVQLIGGRGRDHLCLAAVAVVEGASGGWRLAEPAVRG